MLKHFHFILTDKKEICNTDHDHFLFHALHAFFLQQIPIRLASDHCS